MNRLLTHSLRNLFLSFGFLLFALSSFAQASGNIDLGSEITNGIMTDGCVSSCQPTYCTNQSDNAGNHAASTMVITITGIPAANSVEITLSSVQCGSTSGLDDGDNVFIDGVQVVNGSGNLDVNQVECVVGGADIVIEFIANRRDEILNVSWISGPTDPSGMECIEPVLPVDYATISARQENEHINLHWRTIKETQSDFFEILHSSNGRHYTAIGKVLAAGDSDYGKEYNFSHEHVSAGHNYYRLKQVDFNGAYQISKTVTVTVDSERQFSVRPTLANDRLVITHPSNGQVHIINLQGQVVRNISIAGEKEIDISNLSSGMYIISTTVNGQRITKKVLKN